jgi:hypothetical protein
MVAIAVHDWKRREANAVMRVKIVGRRQAAAFRSGTATTD